MPLDPPDLGGLLDAARYGEPEDRIAAAEDLRLLAEFRVCAVDEVIWVTDQLLDIASCTTEPRVAGVLFWVAEEFARSAPIQLDRLEEFVERFDGEPDLIAPFLRLVVHDGRRRFLPVVLGLLEHPDPAIQAAAQVARQHLPG